MFKIPPNTKNKNIFKLQIIDIYLTAYGGATVWFADNQALQGSLIHTLKVIHIDDYFFLCNTFSLILIIGSQDHVLQSFSLKLMLSKPGSTSDEIFWSSPSLGEDPRENDGGLFAVYIIVHILDNNSGYFKPNLNEHIKQVHMKIKMHTLRVLVFLIIIFLVLICFLHTGNE